MMTDPEEVKQAAADHFQRCFDGAGTTPWFEGTPQAAGVAEVYADTAAGRAHREDLLRGKQRREWAEVPWQDHTIATMLKRKQVPVGEAGVLQDIPEKWYQGVLQPISMEDWQGYWRKKARFTSAGRSGIRPDMVKGAPESLQEWMCRLYSTCFQLKTFPDQWRESTVVPIPKKPGATALGELRPLKLLEVTRKAAMGIMKGRLKKVMEGHTILHPGQHGFRSDRHTATAAMTLLNAAENARFLKTDLHVLCLDIRKAYDTVIRAIGTEGALRRLGVPLEVAEIFMEVERRSRNDVRTTWDPLLELEQFMFPAERGFVQGSAVSPLLWTACARWDGRMGGNRSHRGRGMS
jgi:hypothetical protein